MRREFSGTDEASLELWNRLWEVAERYLASGHIGIGQEGYWVRGDELDHALTMEFGRKVQLRDVLLQGLPHEVLTAVEVYMIVAGGAPYRFDEIKAGFHAAFALSGSVYYLDRDGRVALRMQPDAAARVKEASEVLTPSTKAKGVFDGGVSGLLSRRAKPEDVVRDVYVAFEEYLKQTTGKNDFAEAVAALRQVGTLTSTQAALMGKLEGFRSETFGSSHAGKARTPTEADALWFVETVSAQVTFIANVAGKKAAPNGQP
jgi:hypothetical protein